MISPKMYQNEAGDSYKNDAYIKRCIWNEQKTYIQMHEVKNKWS